MALHSMSLKICCLSRSFKVIENCTIRKIAYEFLLFVFYCNYGHILYSFGDKGRCWSKIAIVSHLYMSSVALATNTHPVQNKLLFKTYIKLLNSEHSTHTLLCCSVSYPCGKS